MTTTDPITQARGVLAEYAGSKIKSGSGELLSDALRALIEHAEKLQAGRDEAKARQERFFIAAQKTQARAERAEARIAEALAVDLRHDISPYQAWPRYKDEVRRILKGES